MKKINNAGLIALAGGLATAGHVYMRYLGLSPSHGHGHPVFVIITIPITMFLLYKFMLKPHQKEKWVGYFSYLLAFILGLQVIRLYNENILVSLPVLCFIIAIAFLTYAGHNILTNKDKR